MDAICCCPQTLGIATALKVLFSDADCGAAPPASLASNGLPMVDASSSQEGASEAPSPAAAAAAAPAPSAPLHLERNEVIALVNLLSRFSNSLNIYHTLSRQLQAQQGLQPSVSGREAVVGALQ